jgi:hypothetical protein
MNRKTNPPAVMVHGAAGEETVTSPLNSIRSHQPSKPLPGGIYRLGYLCRPNVRWAHRDSRGGL